MVWVRSFRKCVRLCTYIFFSFYDTCCSPTCFLHHSVPLWIINFLTWVALVGRWWQTLCVCHLGSFLLDLANSSIISDVFLSHWPFPRGSGNKVKEVCVLCTHPRFGSWRMEIKRLWQLHPAVIRCVWAWLLGRGDSAKPEDSACVVRKIYCHYGNRLFVLVKKMPKTFFLLLQEL